MYTVYIHTVSFFLHLCQCFGVELHSIRITVRHRLYHGWYQWQTTACLISRLSTNRHRMQNWQIFTPNSASQRTYMEYKCGPTATGAPFVVNGNIRTGYMCTYFSCDVNLEARGSPKNNRYLNPYRLLTLFITDEFVCP